MNLTLTAITLAANIFGGQAATLSPSTPISITQVCGGGCTVIDLGNVHFNPLGCITFVPSLQATGPYTCINICPPDPEDYCIINGVKQVQGK